MKNFLIKSILLYYFKPHHHLDQKKIDFAIKKFIQFKMKKSVISVSSNNKTNKRKFIIKNNVLAENKDATLKKICN